MNTKTILLRASSRNALTDLLPVVRLANGEHPAQHVVGYVVNALVHLDALTPAARFIAERIQSTLKSGKHLNVYLLPSEPLDSSDAPRCVEYDFDIYRHDITPEVFLNRMAEHIASFASHMAIGDDVFAFSPKVAAVVERMSSLQSSLLAAHNGWVGWAMNDIRSMKTELAMLKRSLLCNA